jgi:hypothetical protein
MKIIDEMFEGLQNRIARIARLADKAYKKLHDRCHVRELLEKSRRFEFWWKTISSLRCALIHIVRFGCDTRAEHLDHLCKKPILNSIRTDYAHEEQTTDIIRTLFEQSTVNVLRASSDDTLFRETRWKTSANDNNSSYSTAFLLFSFCQRSYSEQLANHSRENFS